MKYKELNRLNIPSVALPRFWTRKLNGKTLAGYHSYQTVNVAGRKKFCLPRSQRYPVASLPLD
jgi:hypothetical protein